VSAQLYAYQSESNQLDGRGRVVGAPIARCSVTEINSLTRTAAYSTQRGSEVTDDERQAYEGRKKAVLAKIDW
jgi:hypothetical protein